VQIGRFRASRSTFVTVLDPSGFQERPDPGPGGVAKVRVARVENDQQAQHEEYILHLDRLSFREEGRQTGYYETVDLRWPSLDKSQVAVQADLVSMYASTWQAQAAFDAQLRVYELAQQQGVPHLSLWRLKLPARLGDCCEAAYWIKTSYGLWVEETFFVRGQILIQHSTWFAGHTFSRQVAQAVVDTFTSSSKTLDWIAWRQEQF
jgi:hypothetical protein